MAKSYSSSAILKHWKAGTECACSAVFETCRPPCQHDVLIGMSKGFNRKQLLSLLSSVLYNLDDGKIEKNE